MTNDEIRLCIEKVAADCIYSLTVLAARLDSFDVVGDEDVQIVQNAAKDVAGVLTGVLDNFA